MTTPIPRTFRLAVEGFGPISSGQVELKPLTLFIGPNNSGKSYVALLLYALARGLSRTYPRPFITRNRWSEYLFEVLANDQDYHLLPDLPSDERALLTEQLRETIEFARTLTQSALQEYFGYVGMDQLAQSGRSRQDCSVRVLAAHDASPFVEMTLGPQAPEVSIATPDLETLKIPGTGEASALPGVDENQKRSLLCEFLWHRILVGNGFPEHNAYYLPPGRSGLLTGAQVVTSMAIQALRQRGLTQRFEVAPFAGVTGDFLQLLLEGPLMDQVASPRTNEIGAAIDLIEEKMMDGRVSVQRSSYEQPALVFESGALNLPVSRASSMVAELAPLDLWLRNFLEPGDLLILDEPEAHLHPENQRRIAQVLVRTVRAGVRVLCPTHSSLILHQISNLMLATNADPITRQHLGFTDADVIAPDEVAVYLFQPTSSGTLIEPVEIDLEFGISEEEFVRVSEAIGDESYELAAASTLSGVGS